MPKGIYQRIIGVNCGLPTQGYQKGHPYYSTNMREGNTLWKLRKNFEGGFQKNNPWRIKKGEHRSSETEFKKGIKFSEVTRKKMSESRKGNQNAAGSIRSEKFKQHLREMYQGEKGFGWKGGISFKPYSINWNRELKEKIRKRDNYLCQMCGQYGNFVHHIDYDKKNCNSQNLMILCHKCHSKTNYNREYWLNYFKGRLEILNLN